VSKQWSTPLIPYPSIKSETKLGGSLLLADCLGIADAHTLVHLINDTGARVRSQTGGRWLARKGNFSVDGIGAVVHDQIIFHILRMGAAGEAGKGAAADGRESKQPG
jgi:hypothetical protein